MTSPLSLGESVQTLADQWEGVAEHYRDKADSNPISRDYSLGAASAFQVAAATLRALAEQQEGAR